MSESEGLDEEEVRRLLGDLGRSLSRSPGDTDPAMPAEITARISDTLAGLEPVSFPPEASAAVVVPLRRRRLRWLAGAAALAALAGGGYAIAHTVGADSQGDSTSSAARASRNAGSLPQPPAVTGRVALPALTTGRFAAEVRQLLAKTPPREASDTAAQARTPADKPSGLSGAKSDCTRPPGVGGRQIEVSLDGTLAQLILEPGRHQRVVTAYDCSGSTRLVTTTVP